MSSTSGTDNRGQPPPSQVRRIGLSDLALEDLAKSGLQPEDVAARILTGAEVAATNAQTLMGRTPDGYVIPFFDMNGAPVQYYRVKLLESSTVEADFVKYRQPTGVPNHLYFPLRFKKTLFPQGIAGGPREYCIITEGEKKAACATKMGFPCVAVTGVDSWKTRRIILPKDTVFHQSQATGELSAKLPKGTADDVVVRDDGVLAVGLAAFMDMLVKYRIQAIIIFDSDSGGGTKIEVQRAAATLGYELRYRGLPIHHIRQVVLPAGDKKVGLDDFLMSKWGREELPRLIQSTLTKRTAFPRHPNPKAYISGRLQSKQLSRKEAQNVSISILAELEAKGRRFRTEGSDELHYFDEDTHTLYPVTLNNQRVPLHETTFGAYLYNEFGLGAADKRIVEWLATQFTGEPTVYSAETHKVLTQLHGQDAIAYQTGDSHYAIVTSDPSNPLIICENGTHGVLFEQGQAMELDTNELEVQFAHHLDSGPENLWLKVLKQLKLRPQLNDEGKEKISSEQMAMLISLLYYISPWLLRWRGAQLPIELTIGEAGSGKSSLLSLRQRILTGKPFLSNMTSDIRDWYAGITSRGGIYVLDNVHFTGKKNDFRQQLSDEICRLITEPVPHIEMRKLYTSNTILSLPVRCTYAVTAIEQPFYNSDLLQRAMMFELDAIQRGHDSSWVERQLAIPDEGRLGWIANHLAALHRFLVLANTDRWDNHYQAHHRLANYEQALLLMADVLNVDGSWIPYALAYSTEGQISEGDWVNRALRAFVLAQKEGQPKDYYFKRYTVQDIVEWMKTEDEFNTNGILVNAWRLGRYMQSHKAALEATVKIRQEGKKANRMIYGILKHE